MPPINIYSEESAEKRLNDVSVKRADRRGFIIAGICFVIPFLMFNPAANFFGALIAAVVLMIIPSICSFILSRTKFRRFWFILFPVVWIISFIGSGIILWNLMIYWGRQAR